MNVKHSNCAVYSVHCTLYAEPFQYIKFFKLQKFLCLQHQIDIRLIECYLPIKGVERNNSRGGGQICALGAPKGEGGRQNLNCELETFGFLDTLKVHIQSTYLSRNLVETFAKFVRSFREIRLKILRNSLKNFDFSLKIFFSRKNTIFFMRY